jgi:hypothetical protein
MDGLKAFIPLTSISLESLIAKAVTARGACRSALSGSMDRLAKQTDSQPAARCSALCADNSAVNNSVVTSATQNVTKGRIRGSICR